MRSKKFMAVTLAATMVVGSSMTALATDANGATGSGSAFNHVDTDILAVTLPTDSDVQGVFNYYVDPERAIQGAGTLTDGVTAVTPNTNGVYFAHAGAAAVPEVNASVTAFNVGGKTQDTAAAGTETVTVPVTTTLTGMTYSQGWKDDAGNAVVVTATRDSDSQTPTFVKGDSLTISPDSGAGDAAVTGYSIGGSTSPETTGLTITVPSDLAVSSLTYHDEWVDANGDEVASADAPTINGLTPADGNTIAISPHVDAQPAGTARYDSESEGVSFEGKNSVDVDISVAATVTASAGGKDIALVKDQAALDAATGPALLMMLHVGSKSAAVTSDGATVAEKIEGKEDNFAVTTNNNKFVYGIRTNTDTANGGTALDAWDSAEVKLSGKTNNKTIEDGMTAPTIGLTWTVSKHTESYLSANTISATQPAVGVTLPTGVTVSKVELRKSGATTSTTMVAGSHYTVSGSNYTFVRDMVSKWSGATLTFTFSDGKTNVVTVQ